MDGPPNIIHSAERPVLNGECSQSRRETDSSQKMDCNTSDGTSNTKASFPKEKLCKEDAGHLKSVQVHSFPHLQCNGNGSCTEQKQGVEVTESICRSSDYELPVKDSHNNVINEDRKGDASNGAASIITKMQDSHGEDNEQIETLHELTDLTFQTDFEQSNLTVKENNNKLLSTCVDSVQITEKDESQVQDHDHEGESGSLGAEYVEDHTVALWVKWRGKWQSVFQCPRADCPSQTLRAKPTHDRKKYIAIFFPRKRRYSWADLLLIRSMNEFPEPLASGTHRKWKKMVKDLTTPRRYIMQKLAVAMLNISDQLHTEAVIEVARTVTTWKEFAMEASRCGDYSDLGRMLLKLQTIILPTYVNYAWLENSFGSWKQRCQNAHSAESVEVLTKSYPEAKKFRERPLQDAELLKQLFEGTFATGDNAWTPGTGQVPTSADDNISSPFDQPMDDYFTDVSFTPDGDNISSPPVPDQGPQNSEASGSHSSVRRRKRGVTQTDTLSNLVGLIERSIEAEEAQRGPSLEECMVVLNELRGLVGLPRDVYHYATKAFCECKDYRKAFMMMGEIEDKVDFLKTLMGGR